MSACRFRKVAIAATAFVLGFCVASHAGEVLLDRKAPSPTLGHDIPYTLYRPDPDPSGRKWPVVYLFHGLNGTERDWLDAGRLKETVDRLIASRRIKPLIVVMPMAGNGWYVDNPDPGGAGELSRAFTHDLVAHVEQSYTAAPCRAARALGGLSMGGYGALLYAMDNPARYAAAFGMSASIFRPMPEEADERARRPTHMFNGAFGQPFDWQRFNRWNLFPRLPTYIANPDRPALYLAVGEDDFPGLKAGNMAFHKALTEAGVATPFRKDPGGHVWPLWDAQLEPALIWLDGILSASCP